ncbi:MAG: SDR family oxidoreductase [Clostridia bacterium]|nr:SDR family oxidoreductase [Clostridia bacterium]
MDYKKLFDLTGKVCIVTGGTGYLGSENVKALKDFGATVVIADIRASEERWANAVQAEGDMFVPIDIADAESVRNCYKTVFEKYGRIDVVVDTAVFGAGFGIESQLEHMEDTTFMKGIDGSLGSAFRCVHEVIPYMKKTGGSIITYGSMYGVVSPDLRIYGDSDQRQPANYGAGKAGVQQFTRYAAGALAPYGIRVNCVIPGPFPNPKSKADNDGFNEILANKTMLGRTGVNHEMAGAVLLLASDASSFMTGSSITVDGGWTAW